MPFIVLPQNIRYLTINLIKESQELYTEKKIFLREIKEDQNIKVRYTLHMSRKAKYCKDGKVNITISQVNIHEHAYLFFYKTFKTL